MKAFGSITLTDDTQGTFSFVNPEGQTEEHIFNIFKLKELSEIEQTSFDEFGAAKSPYTNGEYVGTLGISDSLVKHLDSIKGYVESVLFHELMDHDDSEDSMYKSEELVVEKIKSSSELSTEEKLLAIQYHLGFFLGNKSYYEAMFQKYEEGYRKDPKRHTSDFNHYEKICKVADYLERAIHTRDNDQK